MNFFSDFRLSLRAYWKAYQFIRIHRLYWFALIPAILMLGIYQVGAWFQARQFEAETTTMNGIVWYLIQLMLELTIGLLFMQFSKYMVVTLLSPLLSYLSYKTEFMLTGNLYPISRKQFIEDVKRGIRIVARNMLWQYFFFLLIFGFCSIFWNDVHQSPIYYITYIIGFYYYGFSFLDYVNERRKLTVDQSILLMRKHRGLTLGIGMIYSLMIWLPVNLHAFFDWERIHSAPIEVVSQFIFHFLLWMIASFGPILASVASSIAMDELIPVRSNVKPS
jgi:CysZ protein